MAGCVLAHQSNNESSARSRIFVEKSSIETSSSVQERNICRKIVYWNFKLRSGAASARLTLKSLKRNSSSASGKLLQDGLGEEFLDLAMPGHGLRHACAGFWYQSCFPPCRMRTHPISSIFCTRSRRFTPPPTRPFFEPPECGLQTTPRTDPADAPGGPAGIRLVSCNPDTLRGNQARTRHPA